MRYLFIATIVTLNLVRCLGQSDFVILKDQATLDVLKSVYLAVPKEVKTTDVSETEWALLKNLETQYIQDYNSDIAKKNKERGKNYIRSYQIKSLIEYKLQYILYQNEKGEKEVWINGFCSDYGINWRKEIISVHDGGNCYFTIRINLSTGKCLQIGTNGYA